MANHITLTVNEWKRLQLKLKEDYSPSVLLIRGVMKLKLGFVVRYHSWNEEYYDRHQRPNSRRHTVVMLDFYNEPKKTWFLLKYSDFINELEHG